MWMSNALSVFTQTANWTCPSDRLEGKGMEIKLAGEFYIIHVAGIRHQELNLCRTSFIFIFGIVGLQTKCVSKVRSAQYYYLKADVASSLSVIILWDFTTPGFSILFKNFGQPKKYVMLGTHMIVHCGCNATRS